MTIPDTIAPLFYEYEPDSIDKTVHADVILHRIMEKGDWPAMKWLLNSYSKEEISSFLERKGKKLLPPRELNYWALICDIPSRERNRWVREMKMVRNEWRLRHSH
jgi:hypothetical protein